MKELTKKIEAILFAVGKAISEKEIAILAGVPVSDVHSVLKELKKQYHERDSPLLIIEEGDSWKLTVHETYLSTVQQITPHTELSRSILETLAVVAWKQPAKQSDVVKIRTNKAYDHIAELERLGFVAKEKHGRTFLLKVTGKFFDYFDLPKDKNVKELFKDIKDIEEVVQTKLTEQGENIGLDTYGVKPEIELEKKGKKHVGDLEVFEDISPEPKQLEFEEDKKINLAEKPKEENPVIDFIKENKKLSPQEEEVMKIDEGKEENENTDEEEQQTEEETEERQLDPELEEIIKEKKKEKK